MDLPGIPTGFGEEPLQALLLPSLRPRDGLRVGERGQGLVALRREQQPLQVAPAAVTLGASTEEAVEADDVLFEGAGDGETGSLLVMAAPPYATIGTRPRSYFNKLPVAGLEASENQSLSAHSRGKRRRNVAPPSFALSATRLPPWARARSRAMASPRPMPPPLPRVREVSAR